MERRVIVSWIGCPRDNAMEFLRRGAECVSGKVKPNTRCCTLCKRYWPEAGSSQHPGCSVPQPRKGHGQAARTGSRNASRQTSTLAATGARTYSICVGVSQGRGKDTHGIFLAEPGSRVEAVRSVANWCAKPIFGDSYQLRPAERVV